MKINERARLFAESLEKMYPDADCTLDYADPLHLIIATQLAAQCTDARVNTLTPALFKKYPSAKDFAEADIKELESIIRPTGFYRNKAKNIIECCKRLCDTYGGIVPDNMEDLLTLRGVGRKTANLTLGDAFGKGGMVIDTHAGRILRRAGFTESKDPEKIERDTEKLFPRETQSALCHRLVFHGRAICKARKAHCEECAASAYCAHIV
ncbi:MAG: endonuclease III [Clostridia bacterium]|nr:endonuclease III [Clostridia bacterium]